MAHKRPWERKEWQWRLSGTSLSLFSLVWATAVQSLGFENSSDKHRRKSHVFTACPSVDDACAKRVVSSRERTSTNRLAYGRFFHFHRRCRGSWTSDDRAPVGGVVSVVHTPAER
ncbi:unnamed protein product [Ectocarpus sp. 4 AP-2014]